MKHHDESTIVQFIDHPYPSDRSSGQEAIRQIASVNVTIFGLTDGVKSVHESKL
jgi:hypothetical protein